MTSSSFVKKNKQAMPLSLMATLEKKKKENEEKSEETLVPPST